MCLEMPKVCTVCARHGILEQSELNTSKACETSSIKENSSKKTHKSLIQPKNVTLTFCRTPNMQQFIKTIKKCMNMMKNALIQVQTATRGQHRCTNTKWDSAQSKKLKKISQKVKTQPNFRKSSILKP